MPLTWGIVILISFGNGGRLMSSTVKYETALSGRGLYKGLYNVIVLESFRLKGL